MYRKLSIILTVSLAILWMNQNLEMKTTSVFSDQTMDPDSLRIWYEQSPANWPDFFVDDGVEAKPLAPLQNIEYPQSNPFSQLKQELGRQLFFDPILSGEGDIACVSCHNPETGWSDSLQVSLGHESRKGRRNSMTILNAAYHDTYFWDGRAASLEEQALMPIQDSMEMNGDMEIILTRLNSSADYRKAFRDIMGVDSISQNEVAKVLATFERSVISGQSRFDQFWSGEYDQLNDQELLGLHLFRTKAKCMNCHHGPLFSDQQFHNDGFTFFGRPGEDLGRYVITKDTLQLGAFKTPSLREVARTAPYMHTGTMPDLNEVMDMYNRGMPQPIPRNVLKNHEGPIPESSPLLSPLGLTEEEKQAVIAFLGALTSEEADLP